MKLRITICAGAMLLFVLSEAKGALPYWLYLIATGGALIALCYYLSTLLHSEWNEMKREVDKRQEGIGKLIQHQNLQIRLIQLALLKVKKEQEMWQSGPAEEENSATQSSHETIVDGETGNTISTDYIDWLPVKCTMKGANDMLIYEQEYSNGNLKCTRSYEEGQLIVEQLFYENGQVHLRTEHTAEGKEITEFDRNGNRK